MSELRPSQDLDIQLKLQEILSAPTHKLSELAKIAGLNLAEDYIGADLSGANLSDDNLNGANLQKSDLSEANLQKSNLSGANLSGANLSHANLSGANLSRANLSGANLSHANLSSADLSHANLNGSCLNNTNFKLANLQESDLTEASINLTTNFEKAKVSSMIIGGKRLLFPTIKQDLINRGAKFKPIPIPDRTLIPRRDFSIIRVRPIQDDVGRLAGLSSLRSQTIKSVLISHPDVEAVQIFGMRTPVTINQHHISVRQTKSYAKGRGFSAVVILKDGTKASDELATTLKQHVEQSEIGGIAPPVAIRFAKTLPEIPSRKYRISLSDRDRL